MGKQDLDYETVIRTEVFAEDGLITPRLLSRKLDIHIDRAREYLESFYEKNKDSIHVTYQISGSVRIVATGPVTISNSYVNQQQPVLVLDSFRSLSPDEPKEHLQRTFTISSQDDLEATKAKFEEVTSVQIYSIGKAKSDSGLLLSNAESKVQECEKERNLTIGEMQKLGVLTNSLLPDSLVPSANSGPLRRSNVSAYKPARRPEPVPAKRAETVPVQKPAASSRTAADRKPATVSGSVQSKLSANPSSSSSKNGSTKQPKSQHTLTQSFWKPSKPSKKFSDTVIDVKSDEAEEEQKPDTKSTKDNTPEPDINSNQDANNDNNSMDVDEPEPAKSKLKKDLKEKKEATPEVISDGLRNMFADMENDSAVPDANTDEDGDEKMDDLNDSVDDAIMSEKAEDVEEEQINDQDVQSEKDDHVDNSKNEDGRQEEAVNNTPVKHKKMKKIIRKESALDPFGFLSTKMVEVMVTDSEGEEEVPPAQPASSLKSRPVKPKVEASKANTKSGSGKGSKKGPKPKQGSLMSFFKK